MSQNEKRRRNTAAGNTTRLNPVSSKSANGVEGVRNFPWHALTDLSSLHAKTINRVLRLAPGMSESPGEPSAQRAVTGALEAATGLEHALEWRGLRVRRAEQFGQTLDGAHVSKLEWPATGGVGAVSVSREPVGAWFNAMIDNPEIDYRRVPAPLTPEESGLVTYVLCHARRALVRRGAPPARLSVQPPDEHLLQSAILRGGGAVELRWFLRAGEGIGEARVTLPLEWVDSLEAQFGRRAAPVSEPAGAIGSVALHCPVTAGRVRLLRGEVDRILPGDIVLLEEHGFGAGVEGITPTRSKNGCRLFLNETSFLSGAVEAGSGSRPWEFRLDSSVVHEPRQPNGGITEMDEEKRVGGSEAETTVQNPEASEEAVPPTEMLERPEVEVTVRLGHARISVAELCDLKAGSIVELSSRPGEPVELVANGRVVAKGELVTVENRLGVRMMTD